MQPVITHVTPVSVHKPTVIKAAVVYRMGIRGRPGTGSYNGHRVVQCNKRVKFGVCDCMCMFTNKMHGVTLMIIHY